MIGIQYESKQTFIQLHPQLQCCTDGVRVVDCRRSYPVSHDAAKTSLHVRRSYSQATSRSRYRASDLDALARCRDFLWHYQSPVHIRLDFLYRFFFLFSSVKAMIIGTFRTKTQQNSLLQLNGEACRDQR
jgi:hypothetical protein